jgi:hypothetical protein
VLRSSYAMDTNTREHSSGMPSSADRLCSRIEGIQPAQELAAILPDPPVCLPPRYLPAPRGAALLGDLDRKQGVITVQGKGAKQRRIALGQNCLRAVLHYLDRHRPDAEELASWGQAGEDHLLLSERRRPLTKNGLTLLFARLKQRAGITGKRVSPHILRHAFAIRYLVLGNDPFSLQELLGHEDMTTVKYYMHMNDATIQAQKRKYSPGDHLSASIADPQRTRRRGFVGKEQTGQKQASR